MLEELFKALLHKLMTGEVRVGELDLPALADDSYDTGSDNFNPVLIRMEA